MKTKAGDTTLGEVARKLKEAGCTMQLSYSGGVYHAYVHREGQLVGYQRGDFEESQELALKEIRPALSATG